MRRAYNKWQSAKHFFTSTFNILIDVIQGQKTEKKGGDEGENGETIKGGRGRTKLGEIALIYNCKHQEYF